MALLQLNVSLANLWPDGLINGRYPLSGVGAIFGRPVWPSEDYFHSGRSLHSRMTSLVNLGAVENPGYLREWGRNSKRTLTRWGR